MPTDRTLVVVIAAIGAAVVMIVSVMAPELIPVLTLGIAAFGVLLLVLSA